MSDILAKGGKTRALLLGNEAVVRGALEAGIAVATTYPGTPASEIGDTFSKIAKETGIYFEYSTNEKVAFEVAAGAALCGYKAMVSFKNYGLNVAMDSFVTFPYLNVGNFVIVVADDIGCASSVQAEEDTRLFARVAHIPLLEPGNAEEAKEMIKYAFELSEKFSVPVLVRLTTHVCHAAEVVKLGKIRTKNNEKAWKALTESGIVEIIKKVKSSKISSYPGQHNFLHKKIEQLKEISEKCPFNFSIGKKESNLAIICCGVSYNYALEAFDELGLDLPLLKIGLTWPLPEEKIRKFVENSKAEQVLVLEETEPILENEVKRICKFNNRIEVHGKDLLGVSVYRPEDVLTTIAKLVGKELPELELSESYEPERKNKQKVVVPGRNAMLCPGCPHRASYWAVKRALTELGEDWHKRIYSGDIGCYLLGVNKPIEMQDFFVSMGSGIGISEGIGKTIGKISGKPIVFVGDSTFLHAGIPALINATYNKNNLLLIVLDNGTTAMTGHQPNPAVGITGMQEQGTAIALEEVAKACNANVKVVNCFNINEFVDTVKKLYPHEGISVIIARGKCRLLSVREFARKGIKVPKAEVFDSKEVMNCFDQLKEFNCPAIRKTPKKKEIYIDHNLCWGCGVCLQLCKGIRFKKIQ